MAADQRAVRGTSAPVLGMVLFVASEGMFFAAFFAIYAMSYSSHAVWPPKGIATPSLGLPSLATALMLASSVFVALGLRSVHAGLTAQLNRWLGLTLAAGTGAAALQLVGASQAGFGIRAGIYPSLFYMMTAVALAHIAGGLVFVVMVLLRGASGQLSTARPEPAEAAAIYWHFVVAISVALYIAFSLIPALHVKGP
jgi:cytochrome c oxidase subunit 3